MIRVLELLATLQRAGAERMATTLATGLDRARFECEVVSLYDEFPNGFEPVLEQARIRAHHLGKHRGFDPRIYPRLARVVKTFRPDILHTHSYVLRYAWPVSRGAVVHTVHNLADRETDRVGRWLHGRAMRRGVTFVAISREIARSFREVYGREAAATIPNGVELPPGRPGWRAAHGFEESDVLILSVARLDPQKNPQMLIDALPQDPSCHLLLAGDGSLRHALQRQAGPRVHFLGVRTDIADLLAASDLFALASDYEGMPVAVIEAMGAGLPVVATAVGGVPELVLDGDSGVLTQPSDVEQFRAALGRLAGDRELREKMGERGRERSNQFSAAQMIASYAALFEGLALRS